MTYPERLLAAMEARGVKPSELARALGVTRAAITHFATHRKLGKDYALSADNSVKAARFLRVSHDWLALGEGGMGDELEGVRASLSARAVYIAEQFDKIEGQAARDRAYALLIQLLEYPGASPRRESEPVSLPIGERSRSR